MSTRTQQLRAARASMAALGVAAALAGRSVAAFAERVDALTEEIGSDEAFAVRDRNGYARLVTADITVAQRKAARMAVPMGQEDRPFRSQRGQPGEVCLVREVEPGVYRYA